MKKPFEASKGPAPMSPLVPDSVLGAVQASKQETGPKTCFKHSVFTCLGVCFVSLAGLAGQLRATRRLGCAVRT